MSPRLALGTDVLTNSLARLVSAYENGHRLVVSFSGGKDSTICLHTTLMAAEETGNLPVDVVMRDDEIMLPGTFEYCERVAARDDVRFHWIVAGQPVLNAFSRDMPYYWAFDDRLSPDQWMRTPPDFAEVIPESHIEAIANTTRFPPPEGKDLIVIMGLRTSESTYRLMGIHASKGWLTKIQPSSGFRKGRPIFDWSDGDVWKFIADQALDYNPAYDAFVRQGINRAKMRIAPPAMSRNSITDLRVARATWPQWWSRLCDRLPGVREATIYGKRAFTPTRRLGETWEETFHRTCIEDAPEWIAERAQLLHKRLTKLHSAHSTSPLPQGKPGCPRCGHINWEKATQKMYMGDPFCTTLGWWLGSDTAKGGAAVNPETFRQGAGKWGGTPAW